MTRFNEGGPNEVLAYEILPSSVRDGPTPPAFGDKSKLLFVHGFNTSLKEALWTGLRLEATYDVEVAVFSWPSLVAKWLMQLPDTYTQSGRDFRSSVGALERVLIMLHSRWSEAGFTVAAHSMGSRILLESLHFLTSVPEPGHRRLPKRAVFIAPDLPVDRSADKIQELAGNLPVHIVQNRKDYALTASSLVNSLKTRARLGQVSFSFASSAEFHDVTEFAGRSHSYYVDQRSKDDDVHRLFQQLFA